MKGSMNISSSDSMGALGLALIPSDPRRPSIMSNPSDGDNVSNQRNLNNQMTRIKEKRMAAARNSNRSTLYGNHIYQAMIRNTIL
jgi:hypothetical protein